LCSGREIGFWSRPARRNGTLSAGGCRHRAVLRLWRRLHNGCGGLQGLFNHARERSPKVFGAISRGLEGGIYARLVGSSASISLIVLIGSPGVYQTPFRQAGRPGGTQVPQTESDRDDGTERRKNRARAHQLYPKNPAAFNAGFRNARSRGAGLLRVGRRMDGAASITPVSGTHGSTK